MSRIILVLLLACVPGFVQAAESFHVYAPSSMTSSLWVVEAKSTDDGMSLEAGKRVDIGFVARVIAKHSEKPLLYVGGAGGDGAVITLDDKGAYEKHQSIKLKGNYSYLALDRESRFLMGASYSTGQVDIYKLDDNGMPGERVTALDEGKLFAHSVLPTPDNKFLYVPYVKENNAIYQYRFDAESGKAEPLEPLNAEPPEGTGPRHLVYHPEKPIVYFSNEQQLGISAYEIGDSGQLKLRQVVEGVAEDEPTENASASDLVITPDGKYLFSGIRRLKGDFDQIARYQIEDNGDLKHLGSAKADKIPWGLALSPDGEYLLVTAFEGSTLTAYKIGEDGELSIVASRNWDEKISDLIAR